MNEETDQHGDEGETPAPPDPSFEDISSDYDTLSNGYLSPRHRRLAQLAAEGRTNAQISEELGYVSSRVSILLRNPYIAREIQRLQDRLFEETVAARLKSLAEPALNVVEGILKDRTNKVKTSEKLEAAKWTLEKVDGKAVQKTDIGENLLGVFMDKLDAQRHSGPRTVREASSDSPDILTEGRALPAAPPPERDPLADWVDDFDGK